MAIAENGYVEGEKPRKRKKPPALITDKEQAASLKHTALTWLQ
jgi:hypothetical protein